MTFDDVLRFAGAQEARRTRDQEMAELEAAYRAARTDGDADHAPGGGGCSSGSCTCGRYGDSTVEAGPVKKERGAPPLPTGHRPPEGVDAAPYDGPGERSLRAPHPPTPDEILPEAEGNSVFQKSVDRRQALGMIFGALAVGAGAASACSPTSMLSEEEREAKLLEWEQYFQGNFRLMSEEEKAATVRRLERLAELRRGVDVSIRTSDAIPGVVYGYAFNISKCRGFRNCVQACIQENNLDRKTRTQYIRIFELENSDSIDDLEDADATYGHEVPAEGHFYLGTQCFQCENPPCVPVCPVQATWKEPDGIVVVDYNWCIGCRYCMAACPYWARRFNWSEPEVPAEELNPRQHYLGNRMRRKGCVEKCTFCIQRTREGRLPACAEACPTGARVFGNLLDPDSEIRWVLENKKVFRLKEELGTEPHFWYFMD